MSARSIGAGSGAYVRGVAGRVTPVEVPEKLSIWTYDIHDGDFVIAASAEEAERVLCAEFGFTIEEFRRDHDCTLADWKTWPEDRPFTFVDESKEGPDGGPLRTKALPAEHIATNPRGYFASVNW